MAYGYPPAPGGHPDTHFRFGTYAKSAAPRRNKDDSEVRYLQLAHNVRDPAAKRSKVQVVYDLGREDAANREVLQQLLASVTTFLEPEKALAEAAGMTGSSPSRGRSGVTSVLDALWGRLGIGAAMKWLLKRRRLDPSAERVLFA